MRKDITEQFTDWQSALEKFQQNVKKDIEEIRSQKDEIQRIKQDILDNLEKGRYIRDDNRIIISAPEIIIGNVDKSGILWGGGSKVVIRATNIDLEGVGTGTSGIGSIVSRAPSIRQIAVDPGKDGIEQVVKPISEIVSQAQNIVLRGENADDYFPQSSLSNSGSGIHLSTNGQISIDATLPCDTLSESLEQEEKALNTQINDLNQTASQAKSTVASLVSHMNELIEKDTLNSSEIETRTNFLDIDELHYEFQQTTSTLYNALTHYFNSLSLLAESNRQLAAVKEQKEAAKQLKSSFKEQTTDTFISLRSENISLTSTDGDGNLQGNQPHLLRQRRRTDQGQRHLHGLAGRGNQHRQPQDSGQEHRPAGRRQRTRRLEGNPGGGRGLRDEGRQNRRKEPDQGGFVHLARRKNQP